MRKICEVMQNAPFFQKNPLVIFKLVETHRQAISRPASAGVQNMRSDT